MVDDPMIEEVLPTPPPCDCFPDWRDHEDWCHIHKRGAGVIADNPATANVFNEDSLREAIVQVWGPAGAHVDVFDHILGLARQDHTQDATRIIELSREYSRVESERDAAYAKINEAYAVLGK